MKDWWVSFRRWYLTRLAARQFSVYDGLSNELDCGYVMTMFISGLRIRAAAERFDRTFAKLAAIDPAAMEMLKKSGTLRESLHDG